MAKKTFYVLFPVTSFLANEELFWNWSRDRRIEGIKVLECSSTVMDKQPAEAAIPVLLVKCQEIWRGAAKRYFRNYYMQDTGKTFGAEGNKYPVYADFIHIELPAE